MPAPDVTIRLAGPADGPALRGLAALDSAPALTGRVLIAEVRGEPWAALSLDDLHEVADPFRPSGELVHLLAARARQLHRDERRAQRRHPFARRGHGVRFPARAFTGGP